MNTNHPAVQEISDLVDRIHGLAKHNDIPFMFCMAVPTEDGAINLRRSMVTTPKDAKENDVESECHKLIFLASELAEVVTEQQVASSEEMIKMMPFIKTLKEASNTLTGMFGPEVFEEVFVDVCRKVVETHDREQSQEESPADVAPVSESTRADH